MMQRHHFVRSSRRSFRAWLGAIALAAVVAAPVGGVLDVSPAPVQAADGLGAGGEYHPLAPARIYDSRSVSPVNEAAPGPKPATPAQPTFDIGLLGLGGIPANPDDVLAVVVNITVTEPTAGGWLNAYGSGAGSSGLASIVNFAAGQTVPNLAIVRPGANGKLTVKLFTQSASATAHVIVDVFGWFSTSGFVEASPTDAGARLIPIEPGRILDTRDGGGPLGQAGRRTITIRGATLKTGQQLPAGADVVGVVLNVTGINTESSSTGTFLSVVPELAAGAAPGTSNVNLARGQIKPNMVIVPVNPADGSVTIFNHAGAAHVAVDVAGYLTTTAPGERAGRVVPLTAPYRVFDTREAQWGAVALGPGQAEDWSFADFVASVKIDGVHVGAQSAVIGNLTSAELKRQFAATPVSSYLTVYPAGQARPESSNLNTTEGTPVPNLAIMKYGADATVRVFNLNGFTHYLYDASAVVLAD